MQGAEPEEPTEPGRCVCPDGRLGIDRREKRLQRQFLKDHVNQRECSAIHTGKYHGPKVHNWKYIGNKVWPTR